MSPVQDPESKFYTYMVTVMLRLTVDTMSSTQVVLKTYIFHAPRITLVATLVLTDHLAMIKIWTLHPELESGTVFC